MCILNTLILKYWYPNDWPFFYFISFSFFVARRVPNWRLVTSVTMSMWAATWILTWLDPLFMQWLCWATRAGWLATSWLLTLPNLKWPRTTLPLDTRLVISSFIPMCESLHHRKKRQEIEVIDWMRTARERKRFLRMKQSSDLCDLWSVFCVCFMYFRNDGTEFGGSIFQKVNSKLDTAVHLAWTAGSNNTRFGIGAKYQLDKDASLSVRTDF